MPTHHAKAPSPLTRSRTAMFITELAHRRDPSCDRAHGLDGTRRLLRMHAGAVFLALAGLTACGGSSPASTPPTAPPTAPPVIVVPPTPTPTVADIERPQSDAPVPTDRLITAKFSGPNACTNLEKYLEDTVSAQMRARLEADRDNPFGYRTGVSGSIALVAPAPAATVGRGTDAPTDVSSTNLRTNGVDEPDVMKNDGTRMFVISGRSVLHLSTWPVTQLKIVARSEFPDTRPSGLLMLDSRLIVLSQKYNSPNAQPTPQGIPSNLAALPAMCIDCRYPSNGSTRVTVLDVSSPATPRLIREFEVQGNLINARLIGQSLRMAASREFSYPAGLRWYPVPTTPSRNTGTLEPWEPFASAQDRTDAYNALMNQNEQTIRAQALDAWTPGAVDCTQVMAPNTTSAFGWLSLNSIDLAQPSANQTVMAQHLISEPGLIYTSANHLHVVTRHWYRRTAAAQSDTSYIHRLGFSGANGFDLRASGTVQGTLKDEFSIDEAANGDLRLALAVSRYNGDSTGRLTRSLTSNISVMRVGTGADANKMQLLGKTPELAPGESLQSARFMGNRGFLVTFRQVDPLFTVDLSNPAQPSAMGELKVPGFSTYLHPIDANTLLGIGTFLPEPDVNGRIDGSQRRVQLSLFDVSNMRAPRQSHQINLGTVSSSSAALFEHKAFNYLSAKKRLAVPFFDYGADRPVTAIAATAAPGLLPFGSTRSSLKVIDIDTVKGFSVRGDLTQSTALKTLTLAQARAIASPWITRSVLADDFVYAVSEAAVNVADVSTLSTPVASVPLAK